MSYNNMKFCFILVKIPAVRNEVSINTLLPSIIFVRTVCGTTKIAVPWLTMMFSLTDAARYDLSMRNLCLENVHRRLGLNISFCATSCGILRPFGDLQIVGGWSWRRCACSWSWNQSWRFFSNSVQNLHIRQMLCPCLCLRCPGRISQFLYYGRCNTFMTSPLSEDVPTDLLKADEFSTMLWL